MEVRVLYFAALRDLVGKPEERLELPPGVTTVGSLASYLGERVPGLRERMAFVRLARNQEFAQAGDGLNEGDVIALIPPVAGG
jgi:molybdopterin synthase sulfur carrier subunit